MRAVVIAGFLLAAGLAFFLSPFASSLPDGLERSAAVAGIDGRARHRPAPLADYTLPGVRNAQLSTGLAGLAGVVLVAGCAAGIGLFLKRKRKAP